jgi:choline-sulfatase
VRIEASLVLVCGGILLLGAACHTRERQAPPALVLVSIDTLRPDHLGVYGYRKPTSPEIDRFRRDSVLFRNAVANAPSTLPSHASILTSLTPVHHGASLSKESALRQGVPTLASVLRAAGFATASWNGGGQLHRTWGLDRGFEVYQSAPGSASAEIGDDTMSQQVAAARPWLASVREKPFFLVLHTYEVHHPYTPKPERLAAMESHYGGRLPNQISIRLINKINSGRKRLAPGDLEHIVATYDAEIASADAGFAELLHLLREMGRYESALVVLLSDHGEAFGERGKVAWHGDTLYDEQLRIPLIVKLPGRRLAGTTIDPQVSGIDVAPTLLSILGLPVPSAFSGTAVDLEGRAARHPPWSVASLDGVANEIAVRTSSWKWYTGRLYDLEQDPRETVDVSSRHPEVEKLLEGKLAEIAGSRPYAESTPVEVDSALAERLKSLGYVGAR